MMPYAPPPSVECRPVADSLRTADTARIAAGTYTIVVVSAHGRAQGTLQLWPTSTRDRSPRDPSVAPPAGDTVGAPLYGATDLDFKSIGVPLDIDTAFMHVPPPSSRDPIYPGVLDLIQNWQPNRGLRQNALVIGTLANRRDNDMALDGGGIPLWVRRFTNGSFEGTWGNFGVIRTGSGYFCAFPR